MPDLYPPGWPRCPVCGDFALDGHITCGRVECDEGKQRDPLDDDRDPENPSEYTEKYHWDNYDWDSDPDWGP